MSVQLSQLRAEIASEIERDDLDDSIDDAIRAAIAKYQTVQLSYNKAREDITTTESSEYIVLPADFMAFISLKISYGGRYRWIEFRTLDQIEEMDDRANYYDVPAYATREGDNIRLYPAARDAYTGKLSYYAKYPLPVANEETHPLIDLSPILIKAGAKAFLYANVLFDTASANTQSILAEDEIKNLKDEYRRELPEYYIS